jgi:hypothetical protein
MIVIAFDRAGNATEDRVEFTVRTKPGPPPNPLRGSILYTGRRNGVRALFRLRGQKLIMARISVDMACTGGGRRRRSREVREPASPHFPIAVDGRGGFRKSVQRIYSTEDETERLAGKVTPRTIVGTIAVSWTYDVSGGIETCHTGRFRPGSTKELTFRARRHRPRP